MLNTNRKKIITMLGTLFTVLILVSTVTAVPQQHAEVFNDQLDKKQQLEDFTNAVEDFKTDETSATKYMTFLLNIADILIKEIGKNPESVDITESMIIDALPSEEEKTPEDVTNQALGILQKLKDLINRLMNRENGINDSIDLPSLNSLITLLINFIRENLLPGNDQNNNGDNGGNWFSKIRNIISVFVSIISYVIKGILQGVTLLVGGILRVIGALITLVLLIIAGIQTTLTVGAFFLVFMGFVSKIGLKAFSVMAAPVFAFLAAQFTVSIGSLLGGISMALHAVLAFALFFAIPLLLVAGVVLLTGEDSGDDDGGGGFNFDLPTISGDGPVYMLLSVFLNAIKA